ncbi:MAG: type II toxin-antitoxin system VapC family toxin [Solirubrobacterales bacterium]
MYLDSSAIARLVLRDEPGSDALRRQLAHQGNLVSSQIAVVEVLRTVRRRAAEREDRARRLLHRFSLVDLGREVIDLAITIRPMILRSLDAIHLASALLHRPNLQAFISYDRRQLEAARALGLPALSPE